MAVYLFTFHAYRSWNADRPQGFVQRGLGIQPPNPSLARHYDQQASQPPVVFRRFHQQVLVWIGWDACARRQWRLHGVATDITHVHYLVSWKTFIPWHKVRDRLKNAASFAMGLKTGQQGRKWFSRLGSRKQVLDRRHFDHLVNRYLPKHSGIKWCEGDELPTEPPPRTGDAQKP